MLLIMMDRSDEKVQAGVLPLNYSRPTKLDYHRTCTGTTALPWGRRVTPCVGSCP